MSTQSDIAAIKEVMAKLDANRASKFSYTDNAFTNDIIDGVSAFDVNAEQNVPLEGYTNFNETVRGKGVRTQGASIPRMSINHFFGRLSYNLNKLIQKMSAWMDVDIAARAHNSNEYDPEAPYRTDDVCYITETKGGLKTITHYTRTSTTPDIIKGIPVTNTLHWMEAIGKSSGFHHKYTVADLTGPEYDPVTWYPVTTALNDFSNDPALNKDIALKQDIEVSYAFVDIEGGHTGGNIRGAVEVTTVFGGTRVLTSSTVHSEYYQLTGLEPPYDDAQVVNAHLSSNSYVGYGVLPKGRQAVIWLQGGRTYSLWNSFNSEFTLHTAAYDNGVDVLGQDYTLEIAPAPAGSGIWQDACEQNNDANARKSFGTDWLGVLGLFFSGMFPAGIHDTWRAIISSQNASIGAQTFFGTYPSNAPIGQGQLNACFGYQAGSHLTTGTRNTAIGIDTLVAATTATDNTSVGYEALRYSTASRNTAIGSYALLNNTTGAENTAVGYQALKANTTGVGNTAVGSNALQVNTTGTGCVAVGIGTLQRSNGNSNTGIGYAALNYTTTGAENTALGYMALYTSVVGSSNTAVGMHALYWSTAARNTAIGAAAGLSLTTGSNNTLIGYNAQAASAGTSNTVTLGDSNIVALRCAVTTITALSDQRDKADISVLPFDALSFINDSRPCVFHWDKREWYKGGKKDGSKKSDTWTHGFIAQELDELQKKYDAEYLNLVMKDNPDRLEATPGNLLPIMVQAIKELSAKVDALEAKKGKVA